MKSEILEGTVGVKRPDAIDIPSFAYHPAGWKGDLPVMNASSMVSELAPVVLYLRYLIKPGNAVILEEPEAHLHPELQVKLAQQLCALVNAGVRVILTTHSEWLLEELGNAVRRFELPESERRDVALQPEKIGAWLFERDLNLGGSVVKELPFDKFGLSGTGFDEVASNLHNDWADIHSRAEHQF